MLINEQLNYTDFSEDETMTNCWFQLRLFQDEPGEPLPYLSIKIDAAHGAAPSINAELGIGFVTADNLRSLSRLFDDAARVVERAQHESA